jgi:hypothetical protein
VFAEQVRKPGVNLVDLGETLREEVAKLARSVNHPQVPAVYNQILGARSVFLAGLGKEEAKPVVALPPPAGPQADEIAWSLIEGTSDPKQLSAFVERFPRSALRPKAEAKLNELSRQRSAVLAPAPVPTSPAAIEAIRSCDRLASAATDPDRPADVKGVETESIDGPAAIRACQEAVQAEPANRRLAFQLGRAFAFSQHYGEAKVWYEKGAALGSPLAMNNLGVLYRLGRGVPQDFAEARRWYEKAAALGNSTAMNNLGWLYNNGRGVPQDYAEARRWYVKAAALGNAGAKDALAKLPRL